jgi:hypothetical protein
MRTVMTVRSKEMRSLQAPKVCEVSTTSCEDKVNSEERNILQLSVFEFVGYLP